MSIEERDWYRAAYRDKERNCKEPFGDNSTDERILVPGKCTRCGNIFQVRVRKNVAKNYSYTCPQCGQRMTVGTSERKTEVGKGYVNNAKAANKKDFLNKAIGTLVAVFAAVSCLISLYAGLMIERNQMNGSPWPSLVTAILCWLLVAVIRKKKGNILCGLALCVCYLSALTASGYTFYLAAKLFMEAYMEAPATAPAFESGDISTYLSVAFFAVLLFVICYVIPSRIIHSRKKRIKDLVDGQSSMTPQQFIRLKDSVGFPSHLNVPGIYILHNVDKDKNYVGQSKHVLTRINQHFAGRGGNADVYADYKYHDHFEIKIVRFEGSGYSTLNQMEREAIDAYDAHTKGYNKTRGNKD